MTTLKVTYYDSSAAEYLRKLAAKNNQTEVLEKLISKYTLNGKYVVVEFDLDKQECRLDYTYTKEQ